MTPTRRALADLRAEGWSAQVVEYWLAPARRRIDLFGCIDIVAVKAGESILAVQVTSGTNHAARVTKATGTPEIGLWIAAGGRFEVWSYAKRGPLGKRKVWTRRIEPLSGGSSQ